MATGSSTGLAGVPRAPHMDPRVRRALQILSGSNLVAKDGGVVVNGQGQLDTNPAVVYAQLAAYEQANPSLLGTL